MLKLHDTAAGLPVEIVPRTPGKFSFYACGPTVYGLPHLGHGRAVLTWDILRRYLEWTGLDVHHVANITDIDDKIIERATEMGISAEAVAHKYEDEWWKAMDLLGVLHPHDQPHATVFVERMVELIGALIDRGFAYDTTRTVYFSPAALPDYGLLSRQSVESLQAGARVEADPDKHSPIDFALWKKAKGPEDVPQWPSPWGAGRPGWHTECVVMSMDLLGDGFDLHGGGLDLAFPHHENERAQGLAMGYTFARHWVHHGFIEMGGEKMSKSIGNVESLSELLERVDGRAYRLLVLKAHYRSPAEVTSDLLAESTTALERLDGIARRLGAAPIEAAIGYDAAMSAESGLDTAAIEQFRTRMDADLDTPGAMGLLFDTIRRANALFDADDASANPSAATVAATALELAAAMGLFARTAAGVDNATAQLVQRLDEARSSKDWATADAVRVELQVGGWVVETTKAGTQVRRA